MYLLTIFATFLCCASITFAHKVSPKYSTSSSSFPVLSPSVSILSETPSLSDTDTDYTQYALNLKQVQTIYANFTSVAVPLLRQTSRNIRREMNKINRRSPISQLYRIPTVLGLYNPIFQSFAKGTNLVHDWELATKYPTGPGPFIYFTPDMWNTVLSGLQVFGSSSLNVTQNLMQLEYEVSFVLDNLLRKRQNILIRRRNVVSLDATNADLGLAIQGVRNGLQQIYSVHKMGATKIQTSRRSIKFLGYYFKWIKEMAAVFNKMAPSTIDFSTALASLGNVTKSSPKQFSFQVTKINSLYKVTAKRMAYLSDVLADYFQLFGYSIEKMLQS